MLSPNFLRYGSMACENFEKMSDPCYKTIFYEAKVPALANSEQLYDSKNLFLLL